MFLLVLEKTASWLLDHKAGYVALTLKDEFMLRDGPTRNPFYAG